MQVATAMTRENSRSNNHHNCEDKLVQLLNTNQEKHMTSAAALRTHLCNDAKKDKATTTTDSETGRATMPLSLRVVVQQKMHSHNPMPLLLPAMLVSATIDETVCSQNHLSCVLVEHPTHASVSAEISHRAAFHGAHPTACPAASADTAVASSTAPAAPPSTSVVLMTALCCKRDEGCAKECEDSSDKFLNMRLLVLELWCHLRQCWHGPPLPLCPWHQQ